MDPDTSHTHTPTQSHLCCSIQTAVFAISSDAKNNMIVFVFLNLLLPSEFDNILLLHCNDKVIFSSDASL